LKKRNRNGGPDFGLAAFVAGAQVGFVVREVADELPLGVGREQPMGQRVGISPSVGRLGG
jgi:hypothetical protein